MSNFWSHFGALIISFYHQIVVQLKYWVICYLQGTVLQSMWRQFTGEVSFFGTMYLYWDMDIMESVLLPASKTDGWAQRDTTGQVICTNCITFLIWFGSILVEFFSECQMVFQWWRPFQKCQFMSSILTSKVTLNYHKVWWCFVAGFKKLMEHKVYEGEITFLPSTDKDNNPRDGTRCRSG